MNKHREEWDERLESPAQQAVRQAVRALPEETVSIAWRSELNEKVRATAQARQRKDRLAWIMRPAIGLAVAGAMAMFVVWQAPVLAPSQVDNLRLEAALMNAHEQNAHFSDITGTGLSVNEATYMTTRNHTKDVEWSEIDIDLL